jgi:hypothetical protein
VDIKTSNLYQYLTVESKELDFANLESVLRDKRNKLSQNNLTNLVEYFIKHDFIFPLHTLFKFYPRIKQLSRALGSAYFIGNLDIVKLFSSHGASFYMSLGLTETQLDLYDLSHIGDYASFGISDEFALDNHLTENTYLLKGTETDRLDCLKHLVGLRTLDVYQKAMITSLAYHHNDMKIFHYMINFSPYIIESLTSKFSEKLVINIHKNDNKPLQNDLIAYLNQNLNNLVSHDFVLNERTKYYEKLYPLKKKYPVIYDEYIVVPTISWFASISKNSFIKLSKNKHFELVRVHNKEMLEARIRINDLEKKSIIYEIKARLRKKQGKVDLFHLLEIKFDNTWATYELPSANDELVMLAAFAGMSIFFGKVNFTMVDGSHYNNLKKEEKP